MGLEIRKIVKQFFGEVSERLKEHAWKACDDRKVIREFESLPLRHFSQSEKWRDLANL